MVVVGCLVGALAFLAGVGEVLVAMVAEELEVVVRVGPIHSVLVQLGRVQVGGLVVGGFEVGNFVAGKPVGIGIV